MRRARWDRRRGLRACTPGPRALASAVWLLVVLLAIPLNGGVGAPARTPSGIAAPTTPSDGPPPVPVLPTSGTAGPRTVLADAPCNTSANEEVAEAQDAALGYLYVAWVGCGGIGFARSVDGGFSFQPASALPGSTRGVVLDPSVAVAPNGTVFAAFVRDDPSGDAPYVAWSFDHGATFAGPVAVFSPPSGSSSVRDSLAVAPNGSLAMTWIFSPDSAEDQQQCNAAGDCWFSAGDLNPVVATSRDGGQNWTAPVPLDPSYPSGGITAAPLTIGPDGAFDVLLVTHVVGGAHVIGTGDESFVRSTDGGAHWTNATNVSSRTFPAATPWVDGSLAVDPDGTLYVAFDASNATADDAYVAVSTDNGTTWATPRTLNDDVDASAHGLVTVAAGGNGSADVVWLTNNSSAGWRLFGAGLTGNGSVASAPSLLSNSTGLPALPTGATLGLVELGSGAFAAAWSFGITYDRLTYPQVLSTVGGETPPTDRPLITSVVPGAGQVTVGWLPPTGGGDRVSGFDVAWGLLNQRTFYNQTYARSATFAVVAGLPVDYAWYFEVAAVNGAGAGPFSVPVNVTLRAYGILRGAVEPANASVELDGAIVPTANGTYLVNTTIGLHLVSASAPEHAPFATAVTLPWNGTVFLNISLLVLPGGVTGYVSPLNATVLFDGAPLPVDATGRFAVANVTVGAHVLSVTDTGFLAVTRNLTIVPGATIWVNVTLLRANGTLRLTVTPATATVRFNGSTFALSAAGTLNLTVAPGVYLLNVSAVGYFGQQQNVTILGGSTLPLTLVLIREPTQLNSSPGGSGFPTISDVEAIAVAAAVVLAVAVAAMLVRRRRQGHAGGSAPPALWESDAPDGGDEEPATRPPEPPATRGGG